MTAGRIAFYARLFGYGLFHAGLRWAKNAARLVLRRDRHRADNRVAWQLLGHALGLRRIGHVTNRLARGEGAASQAAGMLMAKAVSRRLGVPYAYNPFCELDHNEGAPEEYARRWDDCLNLGLGEVGPDDAPGVGLDIYALFASDLYNPQFTRHLFAIIEEMVPELRARHYRGRAPQANPRPIVALHVRRGDDVTHDRNSYMWTPPDQVRALIGGVVAALEQLGIEHDLIVVSLGEEADFPELADLPCQFFLNERALTSFRRLVEADVLVMGMSGYSHLAGLLSDGLVIYDQCGFPPMRHWLACPKGRVDSARLEPRIAALLASGPVGP